MHVIVPSVLPCEVHGWAEHEGAGVKIVVRTLVRTNDTVFVLVMTTTTGVDAPAAFVESTVTREVIMCVVGAIDDEGVTT